MNFATMIFLFCFCWTILLSPKIIGRSAHFTSRLRMNSKIIGTECTNNLYFLCMYALALRPFTLQRDKWCTSWLLRRFRSLCCLVFIGDIFTSFWLSSYLISQRLPCHVKLNFLTDFYSNCPCPSQSGLNKKHVFREM